MLKSNTYEQLAKISLNRIKDFTYLTTLIIRYKICVSLLDFDKLLRDKNTNLIDIFIYFYKFYNIMTIKTTVAIDSDLRKIIKKLAAWLDISQGEVIRRAIAEYEKAIINKDVYPNTSKDKIKKEIATILQAATDAVWEDDIKTREIQEKLKKGPSSIDEVILNNWDFGLEL